MRTKITQAVQTTLTGSRKVRITFKRDAIGDITHLLAMNKNHVVALDQMDALVLQTVVQTRKWDVDSNRTVVVTLTDKFDEEWFVGRLWRALDKIEVIK